MAKVLSLFDGISCGMVAFERSGIHVTEYHSCEIDKYAIQTSSKNYPQIVQHGSVVDYCPDRAFDYLLAGSPCQGFSSSGKGLAFDDPRSALYFQFERILEKCRKFNPNIKFLLENVKMKKEHLQTISNRLAINPICINSALVSAQNRVRYYWANFRINQPEDKNIVLADILSEPENYERYRISPAGIARMGRKKYSNPRINPEKTGTINTVNNSSKLCFDAGTTIIETDKGKRRLTPLEVERLQTLPDNYTQGVSDRQRYFQVGNGWTVDVIAHILRGR